MRDLGDFGSVEVTPQLMRRLVDRNLEVRRRAMAALLELARRHPDEFEAFFEAGRKGLDPLADLIARAVLAEAQEDTKTARQLYQAAFEQNQSLFWSAYRAYDTPTLISLIQEPLTREIARTAAELKEHLERPQRSYPQSILRQAFALSILADALGRRVRYEADRLLSAGRREEARALDLGFVTKLLAVTMELNSTSKTLEIKIHQHNGQFELSDSDPRREKEAEMADARARAALELGYQGSAQAAKALIQALAGDPAAQVRARAAEALGRFCPSDATPALIRAFERDPHPLVKQEALFALACAPREEAVALILREAEGTRDDGEDGREAALLALGRLGRPEDLAFLRRAAQDPIYYTRTIKTMGIETQDRQSILEVIARALDLAAQKLPDQEAEAVRSEARDLRQKAARLQDQAPIPASDLLPVREHGTSAQALTGPETEEIKAVVLAWLDAWRKQDLEAYLNFYHPDFTSDGADLAAYRAQRTEVFGRTQGLVSIEARNMEFLRLDDRVQVSFRQDFQSDRHQDQGIKTLILLKWNKEWRIWREIWRPAPE